jgi:sugar/nucleoside kinase (ribokinase family)
LPVRYVGDTFGHYPWVGAHHPDEAALLVQGMANAQPQVIVVTPPLERTGAGDAFFSTFVSYLVKGFDPSYAITRAPINSMNVVQHIGAQEGLLSAEAIEDYLKKASPEYKLTII